jgi:hypothetical protein
MKVEIIKCDICGAEGAKSCSFYVERQMDPAGSMDDVYDYIDLCDKHQWRAYKLAEQLLTFEQAQKILQALRDGRTRLCK